VTGGEDFSNGGGVDRVARSATRSTTMVVASEHWPDNDA